MCKVRDRRLNPKYFSKFGGNKMKLLETRKMYRRLVKFRGIGQNVFITFFFYGGGVKSLEARNMKLRMNISRRNLKYDIWSAGQKQMNAYVV